MLKVLRRLFPGVALALLALAAASTGAHAADRFDVSYFWSRSLARVQDYHDRVVEVLGPGALSRLKAVSRGELYGLVYVLDDDRTAAARVAEVHSRLLESQGLETACPVPSRDWETIDDGEGRREPSAPLTARVATPDLQAAVEEYIGRLRREGRIGEDERTAWSVYDFTSGEKLVSINEDAPYGAASMVKLFIAAAFLHKVEQGELIYGRKSRRHLEWAIQHSDNDATNWILRQVGGPHSAQRILKRNYPGIFRDIRIVEYIPPGGKTYRNMASPRDYSRFLRAVWNGDISGAREIKRLMGLPSPNRIFTGIEGIPAGTRVYNKTGSTARVCGDVGILVAEGPDGRQYPYTIIGIIEKERRARDYSAWIRSRGAVIRDVSRIVYRDISKRHDF